MEPFAPTTSFIPKKPIDTSDVIVTTHRSSGGLVGFLCFFMILMSGLSYGGVYVYNKNLLEQKTALDQKLAKARDSIGTDFVSDMKRLNARITGVKTLLTNHVVVTPIFKALQDTTLRSVVYNSFSYNFKNDDTTKKLSVDITISGTAKSYAAIALQSDAFTKSSLIRNPIFSDLKINTKTNTVDFKLVFSAEPSDLSYEHFLQTQTANPTTI
jgi:hypothetical protein